MVKHTQTIRQQQPTNCLIVFDHFVELVLKELKKIDTTISEYKVYYKQPGDLRKNSQLFIKIKV